MAPQIHTLYSPDHVLAAGYPQRIPFAIAVDESTYGGGLDLPDGSLVAVKIKLDDEVIEETTVVAHVIEHDHFGEINADHQHADTNRYYPLRTNLSEPGIFDVEVTFSDAAGREAVSSFPVQIFDPDGVSVPLVGRPFPATNTATESDTMGVSPICTRSPECQLHSTNVADVIGTRIPLAVLVATPALCSTQYCGPVLDTLIGVLGDFDGVIGVHVEVYENATEVQGNYLDPNVRVAKSVEQLGLTFEPALFLIDGDGNLYDRLDNVFSERELREQLTNLG